MTPGSSPGSIVVEHEVIMEANYTSGYLELFENLTKTLLIGYTPIQKETLKFGDKIMNISPCEWQQTDIISDGYRIFQYMNEYVMFNKSPSKSFNFYFE